MKLQLLAMLALGSVGLVAAQDNDAKKEFAKLQGVWQIETFEEDGANPNPDFWRMVQLVIKDNHLTFKGDDVLSEKASRISLTIDPGTKPPIMDFKIEAGEFKGMTLEGIYQLKGDELKICLRSNGVKERPDEFSTKAGSSLVLFVLKRQKP